MPVQDENSQTDHRLAYAAAKLLDMGQSPRMAAKTTGCPRRQVIRIKEQADASRRTAKGQVIVNYLERDEVADGEYITTSDIAAAMGYASEDEVRTQLRRLRNQGTVVRPGDPLPKRPRPHTAAAQTDTEADDTSHQPEIKELELLSPTQWLGRRSVLLDSTITPIRPFDPGSLAHIDPEGLSLMMEITAIIISTETRRILVDQDHLDELAARGAANPAPEDPLTLWPWPEHILVESAQADRTINESDPNPRPVALLIADTFDPEENPGRTVVVAYAENGNIILVNLHPEHNPQPAPEETGPPENEYDLAAALAVETSKFLNEYRDRVLPQPLTRHDRRMLERKNLINPWHTLQPPP